MNKELQIQTASRPQRSEPFKGPRTASREEKSKGFGLKAQLRKTSILSSRYSKSSIVFISRHSLVFIKAPTSSCKWAESGARGDGSFASIAAFTPSAMKSLLVVTCLVAVCCAHQTPISIPDVIPQADSYICTSVPVGDVTQYITGFEANVADGNAHHILLFGCGSPGSDEEVWNCGEMNMAADGMEQGPTCASKPSIIYAWAKDAPPLELPKDVAFAVGGDTDVQYLVLQVHYMHSKEKADKSGVTLSHTSVPQPKLAQTMLLVTGGTLPAKSTETFETACVIEEDVKLHPFAFRTHTHRHGTDVGGWVVQENEKGDDSWLLIGRRDPQLPQMFAPVANTSLTIQQGDMLSARCVMKNDEDRDIEMGPTGDDEMCNFYVMYWADEGRVLNDNTCFSPGAPYYRWSSEAALNHIPK
ncbi:unnamed protein product [Caenorhabditis auriculariae]|uniref:peptidylglycine monooxygenase n=1 Tax=Caenorhabditis auriculariae TaxID=2777116 RepID=A0A8S1HD48_9PELO|nr:unnamed protein product [Caenorhabditis auriculariae]